MIEVPITSNIEVVMDHEGAMIKVWHSMVVLTDDEAATLRDALDAALKMRSGPPRKRGAR